MCQQTGAAFRRSIARLNTYPLLSYSVKFGRHCQEASVLLWMQSFVICDELSQWQTKRQRKYRGKYHEKHAPPLSNLSTNLSACICLWIHHTISASHLLLTCTNARTGTQPGFRKGFCQPVISKPFVLANATAECQVKQKGSASLKGLF